VHKFYKFECSFFIVICWFLASLFICRAIIEDKDVSFRTATAKVISNILNLLILSLRL
jgi:glucan phosphoethanolaminetransferase (alkaline phosphatase superfamily)